MASFEKNEYTQKCNEMIRPEIKALIERGNITLEEFKEIHCNAWEQQALCPKLTKEALVWLVEECLRANCSWQKAFHKGIYDNSFINVIIPLLVERYKAQ